MIQESCRPEAGAFEKMLWQYRGEPGMLIPMLQASQESYGYVPPDAIERISYVMGIPEAEIYGVITFYKQFRLKPLGRHIVRLCKGTACHVVGAETIGQVISDELNVAPDETTEDGIFTYMVVACLGCCSLAPAMMIDNQTYGRLTPQTTRKLLRQYRRNAAAESAS
ncbi:MAG: NADH-quinone oxidoreductase subunit NuoE [Holophagales bacterium]|jgi:NADH-quinone oxidoreductase subunit E|nr:NADH-quinone oxidoreductase subunit NuoE [Holophagales bacterium]